MAKSTRQSLAHRIATDPALRAKYLSNPGLRSKLPASMLTPAQRQQRAANVRLAAPVVPGSQLTNRDLAHQASDATALKYGGLEAQLNRDVGQAQVGARNTNDYFNAYLAELQQHAANQQAIGANALAQQQALVAGIRNLDSTDAAAMQQKAQADAASRGGTVSPELAALANAASVSQQGLAASFAAQQAATDAANQGYADTTAHVVGPGQKLTAMTNAARVVDDRRAKVADLQREMGAYGQSYRAGAIADESKNVLAQQALGLDVTKAQTAAAAEQARIRETHRATTVRERTAAANREQAAANAAARAKADAAKTNSHGYTNAEWAGMTTEQRRQIILADKRRAPGSASGKDAYGNSLVQRRSAQDAWDSAQILAGQLKGAKDVETLTAFLVSEHVNPLYARAAAERKINGAVSALTSKRLRRRGVKLPAPPGATATLGNVTGTATG